jgi:hypothetical protein
VGTGYHVQSLDELLAFIDTPGQHTDKKRR